ncbi:tape measure domain-containing protein [Microbacterium phyllosphaerae]|uniref:Tape measure domain-containing protein n=1 Tax=Microbacterium phyllosphaerae TaxID=124798 RepID=A0ABS4WRL4_9MICO|nr:tape measure protein [Microbacterium phyllosphaerae]MBP2378855.1 tape measure domain-containing protein [Microbacterium phyllosphaerae]
MAQEIGVAYVSLLPSGTGFSKAVDKEAGQAFGGAEKRSRGFFTSLASGVGKIVGGVGLLAGTVGAIALGGGISRALNIEDATAKLKGLGHDTKAVEAIMKDALASVKGTAFGLDAAATTAATAVAAGIKPGQELERYLRLTADAATIAGVSLEEMGSILNKATTSGKVYTQELNQLADRGLPIFQWLQDEYGVTAEELRKMVEQGQVDAATFRKVIEDNIGGAALASGETTRGALANVGASLSRLGALFAGPALGLARDFFNEVIVLSDGIASRLTPAVEGLQFAADGVDFDFADQLLGLIDGVSEKFSGFGDVFGGLSGLTPVFTALAGAMAPLLSMLPVIGRFLPVISGPVGAIIGLLAGLLIESEPLRESLAGLAEEVGGALTSAFGSAEGSLSGFGPMLSELLQVLGSGLADAIVAVTPTIGMLIETLGQVFEAVSPLFEPLMQIVTAVLTLLGPLGELVGAILPPVAELFTLIAGSVADLAGTFLNALLPVVEGLVTALGGLISFIIGVFTGDWDAAWTGLQTVFSGVWDAIVAAVQGVGQILAAVWNGLVEQMSGVINWLTGVFMGAWMGLVAFFGGIWKQITNGITSAWNNAMTFLGSIPKRVQNFFSGVGTWLLDSGQALIQGFIDGISSMVGAVGDAVNGVLEWAGGFFPHSPAKRGTFSGSGWTAVADGGASLMEQFTFGAEKFKPEISFSNMTSLIGASSPAVPRIPDNMRLVVEGHEFNAYVDTRADGRIGSFDETESGFARRRGLRGN